MKPELSIESQLFGRLEALGQYNQKPVAQMIEEAVAQYVDREEFYENLLADLKAAHHGRRPAADSRELTDW
jgi:predicted transcriptional regulator